MESSGTKNPQNLSNFASLLNSNISHKRMCSSGRRFQTPGHAFFYLGATNRKKLR